MRGTFKLNSRKIQSFWSDTTREAMSICFVRENQVNINRIFFLNFLHYHFFTCTSYFWNNVRLLGILGGQLLAPELRSWPLILAGLLFIMLLTLLKQIINVLKPSRLHCHVGFMVSITITWKITSLLNLSRIRGPTVSS